MKTRALIATLVLALIASTVGFMYAVGGGPFAEAAEADVAIGVDPELLVANLDGNAAATDDAGRDGDADPARRVDAEEGATEADDGTTDKDVADAGATESGDHADVDHHDDDHTTDPDHTTVPDEADDDGVEDDGDDDATDGGVTPPVIIDCAAGHAWDHHLETCVEIPPVIIDCIPGFVYDHELDKCVEIPPVIIDCIPGFVYDHELEKCVEVDVPLPICPLTHFLNDAGECEPFDFEIPEPLRCPAGHVWDDGICVPFELDLDLIPLDPVLPPAIDPDLLPDLGPGLLNPVFDPPRFDLGFGG